jgi:hypothetical protein
MAAQQGCAVKVTVRAVPDFSLEDHWKSGARNLLASTQPDFVILQQGPSTRPESREHLARWTRAWADAARATAQAGPGGPLHGLAGHRHPRRLQTRESFLPGGGRNQPAVSCSPPATPGSRHSRCHTLSTLHDADGLHPNLEWLVSRRYGDHPWPRGHRSGLGASPNSSSPTDASVKRSRGNRGTLPDRARRALIACERRNAASSVRPDSDVRGGSSEPEATFVGEGHHGPGLPGEFASEHIVFRCPARGRQVFQNLVAIRQVHEGATRLVLEVAVAKLHETRILRALLPADRLETPEGAFGPAIIPIMGGEKKGRAGATDTPSLAHGFATTFATRDLHQPIEHEQHAVERWHHARLAQIRRRLFSEARIMNGRSVASACSRVIAVASRSISRRTRLIHQLLGKVEGGQRAESRGPTARSSHGPPRSPAQAGTPTSVRKKPFDQLPFRHPESERVRRARVVDDGGQIVEIRFDGRRSDLLHR